jgi:flagellar biosynthetic protein FliS
MVYLPDYPDKVQVRRDNGDPRLIAFDQQFEFKMIDFTQTYRKMQVSGASKVGFVVALYETMIADLAAAIAAIREGNIERRSAELQHALTVLGYLQATLDRERGCGPAQHLERFYSVMRARIMEGQLRASAPILDSVIGHMTEVCDAWRQVDDQLSKEAMAQGESGLSSANWTA